MCTSGCSDFPYCLLLNRGNSLLQEVDILKSVSYDRNVVQFYGTCLWGDKTMLVLEFMEVG